MKILKIASIVAGIHAFFFILIFAIPGCSSTTKPAPTPADTVAKSDAPPAITVPNVAMTSAAPVDPGPALTPPPTGFNPDAPATYAGTSGASPGIRFTPTRPNTPAASVVQAQPVENVTPATTYEVKPGDNLWSVAKKFHVSYKDVAAANNLKSSAALHEHQKLIIPSKSVTSPAAPAPASAMMGPGSKAVPVNANGISPASPAAKADSSSGSELTHTVLPGETLGGIAKKYGVSVRDLGSFNNIAEPQKIRPGTQLKIPGWKSTGGARKGGAVTKSASTPPPEPAPTPNLMEPEQPTASPSTGPANGVPMIRLDDSPATPAPTPKP